MDLQVLKFFCVIAEEKSFLAASRKLNYAQSNLSVKIQQLEKELNTELFIRNSSGVSLTEKGTVLFHYAKRILTLTDEAKISIQTDNLEKDILNIGSMESSAVALLPSLLSKFHEKHPNVKVSVQTGTSALMIQKLLKHEIDGAFIAGASEHSELSFIPVRNETLVLAANSSLKIDNVREVLSQPLVVFPYGCSYRQVLEQWLCDENIVANQVIEFSSLGAVIASISAGLGIALLPLSTISFFTSSGSIKFYEISEQYRTVGTKFIFRKDKYNNAVLNHIIEIIQND